MIGPAIPDSTKRSTTPEAGPSIGPQIPTNNAVNKPLVEEEEEEDDYVPELPPDLAAQRTAQRTRVLGPSLPSAVQNSYDDSDDEDVGPMPLPAHLSSRQQEKSAVEEFLEREKRRQQALEVRNTKSLFISWLISCQDAAKPKALKREEWMLVPPSKSDLLGCTSGGNVSLRLNGTHAGSITTAIDTTRLTKGRKFAPSTNPNAGSTDTSLWTETPAERQQRLADELSGKKRRKENSEVPDDDGRSALEARKRQRTESEIQKAVAEHNVRGFLVSFLSILTYITRRGKTVQIPYSRCMQVIRKLRNQSRKRTSLYGITRGIWRCPGACWTRNRETKLLRSLLACPTDLDPVSLPDAGAIYSCQSHFIDSSPNTLICDFHCRCTIE